MAYSPFDLTGKVALVTGGNSGIGLGMAQAMAQAGADVAIWGTNAAKNAAAAETLQTAGRKILALECDVGDEAAVEAAFARTLETLGRVDGCFANAGVSGRGGHTFLEMSSAEWHRVTRINLDGAFYTFRTAAKHMVERGGGGVLVGTASLAAIEAAPRSEHYAATKGGMISMVRAMAVEFARYGVRAHSILPGWIATNMTANAVQTDGFKTKVLPRVPMRRWGEGDDFGGIGRVPHELGLEVSHRGHVRDRWRIFLVLSRAALWCDIVVLLLNIRQCSRAYILVHAKEVIGIIFGFDRKQASVVGAIGGSHRVTVSSSPR